MVSPYAIALVSQADAIGPPHVNPGAWDVVSKVVDITMPGAPGFLIRMARGKSKAEHKRVSQGQGFDALLAPDPKARCRIESQSVADGRYAQTLACPQKKGTPLHIVRSGSYDASGFAGQAIVTGTTPKEALRITLDHRTSRVGA